MCVDRRLESLARAGQQVRVDAFLGELGAVTEGLGSVVVGVGADDEFRPGTEYRLLRRWWERLFGDDGYTLHVVGVLGQQFARGDGADKAVALAQRQDDLGCRSAGGDDALGCLPVAGTCWPQFVTVFGLASSPPAAVGSAESPQALMARTRVSAPARVDLLIYLSFFLVEQMERDRRTLGTTSRRLPVRCSPSDMRHREQAGPVR
ncbi:hypothetical protein [Salinispora arenicola]|uniref:hypothetical protein n=1 Tax=Salinispora arenicola TaxID=168697 RepID=UPI0027DB1D6C|nr:hypothetical protein [Salinispora arenicola]